VQWRCHDDTIGRPAVQYDARFVLSNIVCFINKKTQEHKKWQSKPVNHSARSWDDCSGWNRMFECLLVFSAKKSMPNSKLHNVKSQRCYHFSVHLIGHC
jgi:hypothetical protein